MNTMTSLDFLNNIVNPARVGAGESAIRGNDFLARVMDELDFNESFVKAAPSTGGRPAKYVDLTEDQMRLVGMRESKAVRRAVLAELNRLYAKAEEKPKDLVSMLRDAAEMLAAQQAQIGKLTGQMATVTDLAREFNIRARTSYTAKDMNVLLCRTGLQVVTRRQGLNSYYPTVESEGYCKVVTGNTAATALHWDTAIVDVLLEKLQ